MSATDKPIICWQPNCGVRLEKAQGHPPLCFDHLGEYIEGKARLVREGHTVSLNDIRRATGLDAPNEDELCAT